MLCRHAPRRTAPPPGRSDSPRHLLHALERFPDDPQLRLARIVAWTWGRDDEPVRNSRWHRSPFAEPDREQAAAIVELQPLVDDAVVGAEALVRIGHIHFTLAEYPEALSALERAQARDAADPAIRYLAFFSAGRALEALNRPEEAMARYAKALEIVPGAESAALALATLQFVRDDRDAAVSRLDAIFNRPAAAPDPGRLVGYGSFLHWPALRDAMRKAGFVVSTNRGADGLSGRPDLAGLNLSHRPSVLVECVNMRNAEEAATASSPEGRDRYAAAIADGILAFLRP